MRGLLDAVVYAAIVAVILVAAFAKGQALVPNERTGAPTIVRRP